MKLRNMIGFALAFLIVVGLGFGLGIGSAEAASKKFSYDTPRYYDFGPNERIGVSAGRANGKAWVRMTVYRPNGQVSYRVKGKMNRKRIKADFGSFGRVNLRFVKAGSFESIGDFELDGCWYYGRAIYGTLRGRLVYRGEGGLKKMDTRKYERFALQLEDNFPAEPCRDQPLRDALDPGALHLIGANSEGGGAGSIGLELYQPGYFAGSSRLDVFVNESIGKVAVSRHAYAYHWMRGSDRMLVADETADTAVLTAKGAVRGSAGFVRTDVDGGNWTGNLRILLPGRNMTALAGPAWRVNVYYPLLQGSGP